jgi:hypothetical protein
MRGLGRGQLSRWLDVIGAVPRHAVVDDAAATELSVLLLRGDVASMHCDAECAARIFEPLRRQVTKNPFLVGPMGLSVIGPTARVAGDLANLLGREAEARQLYEETVLLGERMQAKTLVLLGERRLASLKRMQASKSPHRPAQSVPRLSVTREGDVWRIGTATRGSACLKDGKGVHYLAELLAHPNENLHVTELWGEGGLSQDAVGVLDGRAKAAYRRRLEDLRETLDEATGMADVGRAARARAELEAISDELASALGLGGRDRTPGAHVQRARVNVQRRLRAAINRIGAQNPFLGRYLSISVKTGVFCSFSPVALDLPIPSAETTSP